MLDANLKTQLKTYLEKVTQPIEIVASLDDSAKSAELNELLEEVTSLSDQISLVRRDDNERKPSFAINRVGSDIGVRFAGIPMGHEFTSLVLALLQVGGHPSKTAAELIEQEQDQMEPAQNEATGASDGVSDGMTGTSATDTSHMTTNERKEEASNPSSAALDRAPAGEFAG